ncbi:Mitochondrial distribution and morphology protein 31, mitochondrial precursor [Coemansia biformis]|uniref:Mitochondrial distribution and morphology protein 31, mitochondrial n=1 Tax=Coemansia biformis TaxID=1286918 RepID=A0A9W8CZW5_9FUNG|nr:Mitochondrial distribution and morphology protein 31, mitochondrial precursor [Coemansia biformis]
MRPSGKIGAGGGAGPQTAPDDRSRCKACKSTSPLEDGPHSQPSSNTSASDARGRPRLAEPDAYRELPKPQVDPLYFYHFPTRLDIMHELSGFVPRLRARIRRALKGSYQKRPWTIDDIFAVLTWLLMSQAMLLLIGTTTTVSVALWLLNRLNYQDWISRKLGNWVSTALGVSVSFESAIVPAWRSGAIRFKNVEIRCGPEHGATLADGSRDTNFTAYDLRIDQVDVALSLWRWMDDRGLIRECSVQGVRGVVDRRQVWWDPDVEYDPSEQRSTHRPGYFDLELLAVEDMLLTVHPWQNFRPITVSIYSASLPRFRDRWLLHDTLAASSVVGMYDGSLFTIHQAHQRLPAHARAIRGPKALDGGWPAAAACPGNSSDHLAASRERMAHVQIDNLNIDHINSGIEGPVGWITSGRLNVSALIGFPLQPPGTDPAMAIKRIVEDINDSIDVVILPSIPDWSTPEKSPSPLVRGMYHLDLIDSPLAQKMHERLRRRAEREGQRRLEQQRQRTASWSRPLAPVSMHQIEDHPQTSGPAAAHTGSVQPTAVSNDPTAMHVDLQVEFNDIRAAVPLTIPKTGYPLVSSVLVRPVIAYMNAHRMSLPMRCQLRLRSDDFDGAWSFWESGADQLMAQGIGAAFAQLALNERERNRRLKLVGWWSITAAARQMARILDFVYARRSFFDYFGAATETDRV